MEGDHIYVDITDEELLNNYRVLIIPKDGDISRQYSIPLKRLKRLMEKENESGDRETL